MMMLISSGSYSSLTRGMNQPHSILNLCWALTAGVVCVSLQRRPLSQGRKLFLGTPRWSGAATLNFILRGEVKLVVSVLSVKVFSCKIILGSKGCSSAAESLPSVCKAQGSIPAPSTFTIPAMSDAHHYSDILDILAFHGMLLDSVLYTVCLTLPYHYCLINCLSKKK